MAEILLRVKDQINEDIYKTARSTQRGDVISVQVDGWQWGTQEKIDPQYRILKLPNLSVIEGENFLGEELETDIRNPSRTLQRRQFKIDLDNLPAEMQPFLSDDLRSNDSFVSDLTYDVLHTLKLRKLPIIDPIIFGGSNNIF